MTNAELNEAVALHLHPDWRRCGEAHSGVRDNHNYTATTDCPSLVEKRGDGYEYHIDPSTYDYAGDANLALTLVPLFDVHHMGYAGEVDGDGFRYWYVRVESEDMRLTQAGDTLAEAICRAYLAAKGETA